MRRKRPYEFQMERIGRWQKRIENIIKDYENGNLTEDPVALSDMIYAFFTCCDHMKDYIINDKVLDIEQSPYDYIKDDSPPLRVCRAISVGTKHLTITNPKIIEGKFQVNLVANRDEETGELSFNVNLKSKTVKQDFTILANECIQAWKHYIEKEIESKPKRQVIVKCPSCKLEFNVDFDLIMTDCPECGQERILVPEK